MLWMAGNAPFPGRLLGRVPFSLSFPCSFRFAWAIRKPGIPCFATLFPGPDSVGGADSGIVRLENRKTGALTPVFLSNIDPT